MTKDVDATPHYLDFERRILQRIVGFNREHDPAHLEFVSRELALISELTLSQPIKPLQRMISIEGWAQNRFGVSVARLRRLNPEYKVSIIRLSRPDAPRRKLTLSRHLGFKVLAKGKMDAKPFKLDLRDVLGRRILFGVSRSDADAILAFLGGQRPLDTSEQVDGFIDEVIVSASYSDSDRSTWFGALVTRNPEAILSAVKVRNDKHLAERAANVLRAFRENTRWADKFALIAFGESASFNSDLQPVLIWRPEKSRSDSAMMVPTLLTEGPRVRSVLGENPMPCPSTEWFRFENAILQSGSTVIVDGQLMLFEEAADPGYDFVAGQYDTVFGAENAGCALIELYPPQLERIPEGILLSGRSDANWYHWVIEYLPRLLMIPPELSESIPLLVTDRVPATGLELLRSITDRPIRTIPSNRAIRIDVLHVVAPPTQVVDTTQVQWPEGLRMNPHPLHDVRNRVISTRAESENSGKIFLRRSTAHRGVTNQAELEEVARRMGFTVVDPSSMTWNQQLSIFSSADILVGASGAVMANYLFMQKDARVLSLTSKALHDFVLPAAICEVAGVHFSYLTGPNTSSLDNFKHRRDWMHSSFTIDPQEFEHAVAEEIASSSTPFSE